MTKLILASNSAARKKLLKNSGFKFIVKGSKAKEKKDITSTCSAFVMDNAMAKARAVAAKLKSGIVIGADTTIYQGNRKNIGKPKNLKDARSILRKLASKPHWLYTGVAVINAETKREVVEYEKTKIYMDRLSDEEMNRYHRKVSPLDKAGGFDIEGRGGMFIRKIEGSYSNVIGLPMARVRKMLKKMGVSVFGLLMMINLAGCTTEYNLATNKQESYMISVDKEIRIGDAVSEQFDKNFKMNTDVDINEKVQDILRRIVDVCDRKDLVYTIKIIDEDKVNAVSLPGGPIYIFKGVIDKAENDDQIAGVIAHEVGHIAAKHGIKRLQGSYGYMLMQALAISSGDAKVARGVQTAYLSLFLAHSREHEFQSDKLAVKYLKKAGYDPKGITGFLEILQEENEKAPIRPINYGRTHPYISQRIAIVNQEVTGELKFEDYIDLMGEK